MTLTSSASNPGAAATILATERGVGGRSRELVLAQLEAPAMLFTKQMVQRKLSRGLSGVGTLPPSSKNEFYVADTFTNVSEDSVFRSTQATVDEPITTTRLYLRPTFRYPAA